MKSEINCRTRILFKKELKPYVEDINHLSTNQKGSLLQLLQTYEPLFDGTLGKWIGEDYDVELREDATPITQVNDNGTLCIQKGSHRYLQYPQQCAALKWSPKDDH